MFLKYPPIYWNESDKLQTLCINALSVVFFDCTIVSITIDFLDYSLRAIAEIFTIIFSVCSINKLRM